MRSEKDLYKIENNGQNVQTKWQTYNDKTKKKKLEINKRKKVNNGMLHYKEKENEVLKYER